MKRALLACALVACGSRSDLSARPTTNLACTDALDPGAFTPVARYCLDNSNRARALAPQHPHVAWTQPVVGGLVVLVDAQGNTYVNDWFTTTPDVKSFDVLGNLRWSVPGSGGMQLLRSGSLFVETGASPWWAKLDESTGAAAPLSWPTTSGRVALGPDGSAFVENLGNGPQAQIFVGVTRVDASGATLWTEKGNCVQGYATS